MKKRILCYGDSNTWGFVPGSGNRYSDEERWTCLLKKNLGEEYEIIEDGINGRTTCFDKGWGDCKNGRTGIGYALLSNYPIDAVVLMLGTNDLTEHNAVFAKNGVSELIRIIQNSSTMFDVDIPVFVDEPKILLVSPILIHKDIENKGSFSFIGTHEESKKFAKYYKTVAEEKKVDFLDAAKVAEPSETDGLHMTKEGHAALAVAIADKLKEMFKE